MRVEGIKYTGTPLSPSGYGSAARAFITALHNVGVDVTCEVIYQMGEKTNYGWTGELCKSLIDRNIPYKIKIVHLTADYAIKYMEDKIYNILHLFWETDKLPQGWADCCNKAREVWTSSDAMIKLLRESGVKVPIYAFPQPIDITQADKDWGTFTIDQHKGFLFYSIFQWIERKNPKGLLTSYWKAFSGRDDVSLLLKTYRVNYTKGEADKIVSDIKQWKRELNLTHYPRVLLVPSLLTQEEIMRLHNTGDCFISADHGEGWSRPLQEALLMGRTAIATAKGGIRDYLSSDYYYPIKNTPVPVIPQPWIFYYSSDQNWVEPDYEELIKTMQWVFSNKAVANTKGIKAKDYIKDNFNFSRIGLLMRKRIEDIYKNL